MLALENLYGDICTYIIVYPSSQPKDWKACRSECQKRSNCAHWTLVRGRDPDRAARRKKCILFSSKSGRECGTRLMITLAKQGQYMISYLHPSGQAKNEFRISGPRDCSNSGSGGGGSGTPAGFTPCDCCRANRPQICDRLADFDCSNCGTGSNGGNGERKRVTVLFLELRN